MSTSTTGARTATGRDPAPGPAVSGTGTAWLVVARREVMVKLTDRTFLIGTLLTLALIVGLIGVQVALGTGTSTYTVAATPAASSMADAVRDRAAEEDDGAVVEIAPVPDDAAARAAVSSGSADAWLHPDDDGWVLTTLSEPAGGLESLAEEVVRDVTVAANATSAGTSLEVLERGSTLSTALLEGDTQQALLATILGGAFAMLFYLSTLIFGITLANSVVEEKQSRVAEIIAARIPTRHLLAGKIAGNTLLALLQLGLYLAVGLIGLSFTEFSGLIAGVSGSVAWFLVFFLAGFAALACLWAVAGSLASRTEDVQSTSTPLTLLVMAMVFGALYLDGTARTVGSFVPPLSAVLMPIRIVEGDAPWWQALLALALLVIAAAAVLAVGERVYRRSLLQTGGRVSLRRAWRSED
jgi:ABC-2 type transport system permease protein